MNPSHSFRHPLAALLTGVLLMISPTLKSQSLTTLRAGFQQPPQAARPVTWWHWTGGNVTKAGITKDLEWMKRAGIGGFQAFDVSIGGGQTIPQKVQYQSPEWLSLIQHTAAEADRLKLDMTMVTAAGWSETGGTWVKPAEAMKKLVWRQLQVSGGQSTPVALPQPPTISGPFQDMSRPGKAPSTPADPVYYRDQRVLAYPTPEADRTVTTPLITNAQGEPLNASVLLDDSLGSTLTLDVPKPDKPVFLQFDYRTPVTMRSFSLAWGGAGTFPSRTIRPGYVQVSQDGQTFQTLLALPGPQHDIRALPVRTFSFPAVTARYFRVVFVTGSGMTTVSGPDDVGGFGGPTAPPVRFALAEARFSSAGRVNRWEDKAGFAPMFGFESLKTAAVPASAVIDPRTIIDLTAQLRADGTLDWTVPAGEWTILRLGYSLTGAQNGPALPEATGLEVDKLSKEYLLSYMQHWAGPLARTLGPLYGKSLRYFLVDSYEANAQNWTDRLPDEFKARRGYDLTPYLPVLTGRIVGSAEVSDRFLWDFRLTLADLLVDNHYAAISTYAHQQGIKTYGEVAGISLPIIQDALRNKATVDIPMGEFSMSQGLGSGAGQQWVVPADLDMQKPYAGAADRLNAHQADVLEAASAAHVYGKPIVAAESWTGGGYEAPADLKFIGDYWFTQGINQLIVHTSAHQPLDTKPGNTMVGTHFNRNITWAEQARPFVDYLSRTQYLLQQGRFVADIAYYLGEDIPAAVPYWEKQHTPAPDGYRFDYVNTAILNQFTVEQGELVLPSGMRYRVLVLPDRQTMTLPVLQKLAGLIRAGATVVGPKPERSPSLVGYPTVDTDVLALANAVWGGADGLFIFRQGYGQGQVFWNVPLAGILGQMRLPADVAYSHPHADTRLTWLHRQTEVTDQYMLLNTRTQAEAMTVTFRVTGRRPERWNAERGTTEPLSYTMGTGTSRVQLRLEPRESTFVVFTEPTAQPSATLSTPTLTALRTLSGPWTVLFPAGSGAPAQVTFADLTAWTAHPDEGVRYFSGTATYTKTVDISSAWLKQSQRLQVNLGQVRDIAIVSVNGVATDTLWKAPYVADLANRLKPGRNTLAIQVTNQWDNRIVGDAQAPADKRVLAPAAPFGRPRQLKEAGLLGPVRLEAVK